jgi:hypothetical protein
VTRGRTLLAALLVTLATPATWPIALAMFLLRGGIVLVLLPIVPADDRRHRQLDRPSLMTVAFGAIPIEVVVVTRSSGSVPCSGSSGLAAALGPGAPGRREQRGWRGRSGPGPQPAGHARPGSSSLGRSRPCRRRRPCARVHRLVFVTYKN